jgi:Sec-independent protein translocase protein TatA
MLGMNELILLLIVGAILFFFGKDKFREWLSLGKEMKQEVKEVKSA